MGLNPCWRGRDVPLLKRDTTERLSLPRPGGPDFKPVRYAYAMLKNWLMVRRQNYALLRRIADQIGQEFERLSYAVLADPSQPVSYAREVEGVQISWSADIIRRKGNGDIDFGIDFYADLPTVLGKKPSYRFWKRPDGSVYY